MSRAGPPAVRRAPLSPSRLSRELRLGRSPELRRRRWVLGLSLLGTAMGQAVTLFQMGVVRRLPDPPAGPFDSSRVDASDYAYRRLRTPDGALMVLTFAATTALVAAGGRDRARDTPALPIAQAAKTGYDLWTCLRLAREEWQENRAFCAWCQTATLASAASFALSLPEAGRALRGLSRRRPR